MKRIGPLETNGYGLPWIHACTRRSTCTAVVGGSIHRAPTSSTAASAHSPAIPRPIHRTQVRSPIFPSRAFSGADAVFFTSKS